MTIHIDPNNSDTGRSTITCPTEIEEDVIDALGSSNGQVTSSNNDTSTIDANIPAAAARDILCDRFRADYQQSGAGYRTNAQVLGTVLSVNAPYRQFEEGERVEHIFGFPDGRPRTGVVVRAHSDGLVRYPD